ncbi:MAG TPA: amidohydrolase family protein [Streptosporangiaceae bacterium]|nr:amidohydrolase family protein [Streptosporangiaceae bacterium]
MDVVLCGGRVIDPESGLDAVRDVAIADGRVARIGSGLAAASLPEAGLAVDVSGLVVTAGFIDLHSHVGDIGGLRLQALDGVTTALELEAGVTPVADAYRRAAAEGRPVNYGYAASWGMARMAAVAGIVPRGNDVDSFLANLGNPAWQRPASDAQTGALLDLLSADLADGALGVGVLLGYAPGVPPAEYLRLAGLAASAGAPVFTHTRDLAEFRPDGPIDGAEEIVRAAGETGAHMHYCHVNSTSQRHIDRVLGLVGRAQAAGSRVTTEAYPYGSGMTGIGAAFLAPERLGERGLTPESLTYAPTGERVGTEARLRELRAADPGGLVIIKQLDEDDARDRAVLLRSLTFPGSVVASDAMPMTWSGTAPDPHTWPLPPGGFTHPRSAGTFARALRMLTGDGELSLSEALARCSLGPAGVLAERVPAMRAKGRLREGSDADVVVFDPAAITDQASYADSTRPSAGISHVLVNGTFVVRDGDIVPDALPGRPIRASESHCGQLPFRVLLAYSGACPDRWLSGGSAAGSMGFDSVVVFPFVVAGPLFTRVALPQRGNLPR